jgi:Bacterial membrane protein YfhO
MKIVNKFNKDTSTITHILSVFIFFSVVYTIFFSPVIFSERLLAPGDGITQSVPAFYSARKIWTDLILSGFPVAADPQIQTWYPISSIFSLIPESWNSFVVSAYVLASCFTYGYVYTITNSKLASIVSAIIYGMNGFMMAHLGHTMMIHTAAWMPLLIWSLEKLRYKYSIKWFLAGCLAIAFSIFAGHPQIAVYSTGLSAIYTLTLGWSAPIGRWKYYKLSLGVLVLGIALSAIQILPTAELSSLGLRPKMSFKEFNSYSLPPLEAIQLLFPYFFGGKPSWLYDTAYFGSWGLTETTGYVGLLPLMLAVVGLVSYPSNAIARFWAITALVTFLLTLGDFTPFSWLIYHLIPVYNKFRVPSRHFIEMTLAVSVLSGMGVAAIQRELVSRRLLFKIISVNIVVFIVIYICLQNILNQIQNLANKEEASKITLLPWLNPAVGIPIVILLLALITLVSWSKFTQNKLLKLILVLILIIDLGSFGWFYEWQFSAPSKNTLIPTASTQKYKNILSASQERLISIQGGLGPMDEVPANVSRLWGVPNASGYGPLILSKVSQLLSMTTAGYVSGSWASETERDLDIMSVRYVFTPNSLLSVSNVQGFNWSTENMTKSLGSGCGDRHPNSIKFLVPPDKSIPSVTTIGIVSSLGCSTDISNDTKVLQVQLTDSNGKVATQNLQVGRDTSEWAYDCSDVLPAIRHSRALIFENFPVDRNGLSKCEGHRYVSLLPVDKLRNVQTVELNWLGTSGAIDIQKVNLIDETTKQSYPITENFSFLADTKRWHHVEDINKTSVYENLRAMPRVWLVPEVITLKQEEVLNAIKSSNLPDGRSYEPSKIALVEENFDFKAKNFDLRATTKFLKLNDTHVQVKSNAQSPAFLVLSDVYYPGWQAKIDGKKTHIFQTNYVLRGVSLPVGTHVIDFEFKPLTFHLGAGISLACLFLLGYLSFQDINKQKSINKI